MPYVIHNRVTREYAKHGGYGTTPNLNEARTFARRNNATTCSQYDKATCEVLTVTVQADPTQAPFRKGRYLTFAQYQDEFGGDYWRVGDIVPCKYNGQKVSVADYPLHLSEMFVADDAGKVEQLVIYDRANTQYWMPDAELREVYPQRK